MATETLATKENEAQLREINMLKKIVTLSFVGILGVLLPLRVFQDLVGRGPTSRSTA